MLVPDPVVPGLDWVKILDFGIAKLSGRMARSDPNQTDVRTRADAVMGTPLYMAPEQHGHAEHVDGKADVFSLGVILYEMLTGRLPFEGNALVLLGQPPLPIGKINPAVSPRLCALVERMLTPRKEGRPTMREVGQELAALQPRRPRNLRRWALLGGATLLIAAGFLFLLLRPRTLNTAELKGRAVSLLASSLHDGDTLLRLHAVRALGQSRDAEQWPRFAALLQDLEQPTEVQEEAARAIGQVGAIGAASALLPLLSNSKNPPPMSVQVAAAGALAQLHHPLGKEALSRFLVEGDGVTRVQAALLLLLLGDSRGAPLLWTELERGTLPESARVQVLARLALSGDARARQELAAEMTRPSVQRANEARISTAFTLASLGDEAGWSLLRKVAREAGPLHAQLLARRFLASLGEPIELNDLLQILNERNRPDAIRELAMAALADGNREDVQTTLRALAALLKERGASQRLRIAAAGTVLKLQAGERVRLAEQSLSWARAALASESPSTRELAVVVLGDSRSAAAIPSLGQVLKQDRNREVRKSAARALGRKHVRAALQALVDSLDDADPDVRAISMQSIAQVLSALERSGDHASNEAALAELRRKAQQGDDKDRIVASGILLQLGSALPGSRAQLRSGLASSDALVRRLAVEMSEPDGDLFTSALSDSDRGVRFAAARRLVALGSRLDAALAVLREVTASGDSDGLQAYAILRKLGLDAPSPPGLGALLTSADLSTRFSVIDLLPQLLLPPAELLRLLQIAVLDPAAVIRRRAVEVAAEAYRATRQERFLMMVRSLTGDLEISVREPATTLLAELANLPAAPHNEPTSQLASRATSAAQESPRSDGGLIDAAIAGGQLLLQGSELVRVQIDDAPARPISGNPIELAAGEHRISYLGGSQQVMVKAGETLTVQVPVSLAEQLLYDSRESVKKREFARAQEQLDRVQRLLQRGRVNDIYRADVAFQRAQLHEARGNLTMALAEYNRSLSIPAAERRPALNSELSRALARLSKRVGHIQIFTPVKGRCAMTQELLATPGEQTVSIGPGFSRTVFAQAGSVQKVTSCP